MRKGVTLIELLIVISILVILAVIFAMVFIGPAARARDSGRLYDSDRLRKNLEIYRSENDKYPESDEWKSLEEVTESDPFYQAMITYLKNIPRDPFYGQVKDGKPYSFQYKTTNNGDCYKIHIEMEKRDPYEISGACGGDIAYIAPAPSGGGPSSSPGPSGGGSSPSPSTTPAPSDGGDDGGGDQFERCIEGSPDADIGWILADNIAYLDKGVVSGLANDCSGLVLTVVLSGDLICDDGPCYDESCYGAGNPGHCYNDGWGVGADPELGRASSIIPNDGDNNNRTMVDFDPDVWIPPVEWVELYLDYQIE